MDGKVSMVFKRNCFTARCYAFAVLALSLCLSVHMSVTSRCSIETAEQIELVLACELPSRLPPVLHCVTRSSVIAKGPRDQGRIKHLVGPTHFTMPGPNPSVDRRVRWMRRAPGWQGAPDGQQAKNSCYKMFILQ